MPQPPAKAAAARDALAKGLYAQLFDWLLGRINEKARGAANAATDSRKTIGLLDIFGFEAFARNSLEQLLINYAKEQLQSVFNDFIFDLEREEYAKEGVPFDAVDFPSNDDVLQLIERGAGTDAAPRVLGPVVPKRRRTLGPHLV